MFKSFVYKTSLLLLLLALVTGCQGENSKNSAKFPTPADTPAGASSTPDTTPQSNNKSQQINNSQRDVDEAVNKLLPGQAFHQVPSQMKVGLTYQVLAGIAAKRITAEEIRRELQKRNEKSPIRIVPDVSYDPTNVELHLKANSDEFQVSEVTPPNQAISSNRPTVWQWDVKPLKSGRNHLTLLATVNLHISNIKEPRYITFAVFDAIIPVEVNYQYSVTEFMEKNWKEVIGLIFGSGSLAGAIGWYFGKRYEKSKEPSKDSDNNK